MKRSIKTTLAVTLASVFLAACGPQVEVPTAHFGKRTDANGLRAEIIPPSKFRLERFCLVCDSLILLQAPDLGFKESMTIWMPKDDLNLTVDVRGIASIAPNENTINRVFSRIDADQKIDSRVSRISMDKVYMTYAYPVIRRVVRSTISNYSIGFIMEHKEEVSTELEKQVGIALKSTPVGISNFGLADVQPPELIVTAKAQAKEREIAIQKAEADKQVALRTAEANKEVALKRAEADYEVAQQQQRVDLKEAETQVLVNMKLSEGVNEAFVVQRSLKALEALSKNPEGKMIILPMEALRNPGMIMGITNQAMVRADK